MIAEPNRRILYVSPPYCGSNHDYKMLKSEFDPSKGDWFGNKKIWIDLGYLGFEKEYGAQQVHIPHKRPRRKNKTDPKVEFTQGQKKHNKEVSKKRIFVEHSIGGMKRYRFLSDRLRCRNADFYAIILGVCAGLWNFQLTS